VKVFVSKPVRGVNAGSFTLSDSHGVQVPAWVDQIGDGTWALFPNPVVLKPGENYTARLKRGICDGTGNCTSSDLVWNFWVCPEGVQGTGDTSVPIGFFVQQLKQRDHVQGRLRDTKTFSWSD
jgi:hypothetical protein